jgi:hypothetical protein
VSRVLKALAGPFLLGLAAAAAFLLTEEGGPLVVVLLLIGYAIGYSDPWGARGKWRHR